MKWRSERPPRARDLSAGASGRCTAIDWRVVAGEKKEDDRVLQIRTPGGQWAKVPFSFYGVAVVCHYGIEETLYSGKSGGEYFLTHLAALAYWAREEYRPGEFQASATTWRGINRGV